jgi:hypothetical protein
MSALKIDVVYCMHLHIGHNGLLGEQIIAGTVGELVPAVGGTNKDTLGDTVHDMLDVGMELGPGQVTAVESLGANGDGVDDVLVTGDGLLDGGPVLGEGSLREQVVGIGGLADPVEMEECVRAVSMWWGKSSRLTTCPKQP